LSTIEYVNLEDDPKDILIAKTMGTYANDGFSPIDLESCTSMLYYKTSIIQVYNIVGLIVVVKMSNRNFIIFHVGL